jgi:hypothetical protein
VDLQETIEQQEDQTQYPWLLLLLPQDIGQDPSNPLTRLYATHAAQPFHNDSADIVTLLCLRNAKSGG